TAVGADQLTGMRPSPRTDGADVPTAWPLAIRGDRALPSDRPTSGRQRGQYSCRPPTNAVYLWRAGVVAVPAHPGECHAGVGLTARPFVPMHHWQALAEDVHAAETAAFKDSSAALGFEESQPQQHDHCGARSRARATNASAILNGGLVTIQAARAV